MERRDTLNAAVIVDAVVTVAIVIFYTNQFR